ncbi:MAG: GNAT family N-acetyltransferase [Actinomycetota bacterium]
MHPDGRLLLEPLRVDHAEEMVAVLADTELYAYTGGAPPTLYELQARYGAQVRGPADGGEAWRNWVLRERASGEAVGFVQATIVCDEAEVAWLVGIPWQGRGLAVEAAQALVATLAADGIARLQAHIHPEHTASQRVAQAIGLVRSGEVDDDGEEIWTSGPQP